MAFSKSLLFALLASSVCAAQNYDVSISGTVTDTTGAAIPGALVELLKGGLTATSGPDGYFMISGVEIDSGNGVQRKSNGPPTGRPWARICNGVLYANLQDKSNIGVTTFSLQGKAISTLKMAMGTGTNSLALPRMGAGVYLYKIKYSGGAFTIKSSVIDEVSQRTAISSQVSSSQALGKRANITMYFPVAFSDAIWVTKAGYVNDLMRLSNPDTSGINPSVA
jgi:hypothetical protein